MRFILLLPALILAMAASDAAGAATCKKTSIDDGKYHVYPWDPNKDAPPIKAVGNAPKLFTIQTDQVGTESYKINGFPSPTTIDASDFIIGTSKAIFKIAQKTAIQSLFENITDEICTDDNIYTPNLCATKQVYSTSLVSVDGLLITAIKKDLLHIPPTIIYTNSNCQEWGYVLTNAMTQIFSGYPVENIIAGQAENKTLIAEVNTELSAGSKVGGATVIYLAGVLMQGYLPISTQNADTNIIIKQFQQRVEYKLSQNISKANQKNLTIKLDPYVLKKLNALQEDLKNVTKKIEELKKDKKIEEIEPELIRLGKVIGLMMHLSTDVIKEGRKQSIDPCADAFVDIAVDAASTNHMNVLGSIPMLCGRCNFGIDNTLIRYLPMIVNIAGVNNSDEVEKIISSAASPIGTWKLKQEKNMISIGALVGASSAYELADFKKGGIAFGLFAPIGVDISWPSKSKKYSHGLFISVLNVGNLLSTRLTNRDLEGSKIEYDPNSDITQIISPGILYRQSFKNSPFVIGIGAEYTPALRKSGATASSAEKDIDSFRLGIFIAVDVTLFPF